MAGRKLIPDVRVVATLQRSFPPMPRNADTDRLAAALQQVYAELGSIAPRLYLLARVLMTVGP